MPEKANPRHLTRLFALIWPYRGRLAVGLLAMLVTTAAMLAIPQYLKQVFDTALQAGDMTALNNMVLWAFGTVIVLVAGVMVRTYFMQDTAVTIVAQFRERVFAHVLAFDISFFEEFGAGEVVSRVGNDIVVIREFIQFALPALMRGFLLACGSLILLLVTNTELTAVLTLVAVPLVIFAAVLGKKWRTFSKQIQALAAQLAHQVEEAVSAIRTVRVFHQEAGTQQRYSEKMAVTLEIGRRLILSNGAFFAMSLLVAFSGVLFVLWLGGRDVIMGQMSLGDMMAFLLYLAFLGDGASNLASFWPALQNAAGATERVFELLAEEPDIVEPTNPKRLPAAKGGRAVAFEGVSFHYPTRQGAAAIEKFTLEIKAGETVAIVGPSGAGKSTLFSLLLRFYEPQSGVITLDGVPINQLRFADLRGALSLVAQEPAIFSTTIAANIAYGKPNATAAEIAEAATVAHADEFINDLPERDETQVGEKGVRLSGGQKQRVAIARTVLRNPSVLLLDEATSHLDAESEQHVQAALETLRQERTTLVIAHRLATVKSADRIVVLDKGSIVDVGTHGELLKRCVLYKKLAELQFLDA
jgi:ATP-binding cassette subfamily B protein